MNSLRDASNLLQHVATSMLCVVQALEVLPEEEPGPPIVEKIWWQFWKSSNKPLKFGWITGVLVSVCVCPSYMYYLNTCVHIILYDYVIESMCGFCM